MSLYITKYIYNVRYAAFDGYLSSMSQIGVYDVETSTANGEFWFSRYACNTVKYAFWF